MTQAASVRTRAERPFFPRADSVRALSRENGDELPARPTEIFPVWDPLSSAKPISSYDAGLYSKAFEANGTPETNTSIPPQPSDFNDDYLYPTLTQNERLRLTMLWYYTRGIGEDQELLKRVREKVNLVKDFLGWDIGICGLLDSDTFERLVTAGIPRAIVPRRESPCSHTVAQTPGTVLVLSDMENDWRFKKSGPVKHGGLRSYAGTQLRCSTQNGEEVAFGSLCVASDKPGKTLTSGERDILMRFADMVAAEIVNQCRWNRQKQQQRMSELIAQASSGIDIDHTENMIVKLVKDIYPESDISIINVKDQALTLADGQMIRLADLTHGLWEDAAYLDSAIASNNHQPLATTRSVRAIVGEIRVQARTAKALVVASKDVRLIFDDIDARFVERCASILAGVANERSLREALQVKEDFLRGVTHQLRTPIHGVLGSVDLLTEELSMKKLSKLPNVANDANGVASPTGTVDTAEILRTIRYSGQELMSTVNNIIKLHRWAETSGPDRTAGTVSLDELEAQIIDDALAVIPNDKGSGVRILFDNQLLPDIVGIVTDTVLLRECLQSIVLNALQATANGDVVITVSTPTDHSVLCFDVEDTGYGIPVKDQERIFRAYEKSDVHTRGVGLGLTLACRMATAMNGSITLVSSFEGHGSHFRATFRNPTFAYASITTGDQNGEIASLPRQALEYLVTNAEPHSPPWRSHLFAVLARSGFQPSLSSQAPIAFTTYNSDRDQFQAALFKAQDSVVGLSFVPPGEAVEELRAMFPRIIFATGPFTSKHVQDILAHVRQCLQIANNESHPRSDSAEQLAQPARSPVGMVAHGLRSLSLSTPPSRRSSESLPTAPHCLLVDDNLVNLRLLKMYCEKRKYPYSLATDGDEAIKIYKDTAESSNPPTLVLLDLQMPRCDGVQACAEVRKFESEKALEPVAIFILTGQDSPNDREQAFAAGADEFFVKPMSFKVLDRRIAEYFANKG